jgi:hypothetical protein
MWPFKRKASVKDKEWEELCKRYKAAVEFAKQGDYIKYLGVKMLVVGHHEYVDPYTNDIPAIRVEWMDNQKHIQKKTIRDYNFCLCQVIPKGQVKNA